MNAQTHARSGSPSPTARPSSQQLMRPGRNPGELVALWVAYIAMVAFNAGSEVMSLNGVTAAGVSNEVFAWFALSILAIVALLACVALLYTGSRGWATHMLDWAPLSLYLSWMVVATVTNVAHVATRFVPGVSRIVWIVTTFVLLALVLLAAVAMRRGLGDPVYGLVALWAAVGLGVRLMDVSQAVGIAVIAATAVGALAIYLPWGKGPRANVRPLA